MRRINPWFAIPVLAAGIAGGLIGRNVARVSCAPVDPDAACDSSGTEVAFAVIGVVVAIIGVAIVMALVIRSLEEWREMSHRPDDPS